MTKKKLLTNRDGEIKDLSEISEDVFKSAEKVLSASLLKKVAVRGQQKAPVKDRITIRLSHEVVTKFRATGHGWQTRVDTALKEWQSTHPSVI
jgi:uncharacterized protein (DUF4415 family)